MTVNELLSLLQKVENKDREVIYHQPFDGGHPSVSEQIVEYDAPGVGCSYSDQVAECVILDGFCNWEPEFSKENNVKIHGVDRPLRYKPLIFKTDPHQS